MPKEDLARVKQIGTIEVHVHHKVELGSAEWRSHNAQAGLTEVPEKALKGKAISHSVKYRFCINSGRELNAECY